MEMPKPHELRIIQLDDDSGYYLFYRDDSGQEMTDTYHDTLEGAMEQAEFEFLVNRHDWKRSNSDLPTGDIDTTFDEGVRRRVEDALRKGADSSVRPLDPSSDRAKPDK